MIKQSQRKEELKMNNLKYLFCLIYSIVSLGAFAFVSDTIATNNNDDGSISESHTSEVEAEIELDSANRYIDPIPNNPRKVEIKKQKYTSENFVVEVDTLTPKVGAFKVKPQPSLPLLGNYVKAGFGNYITPYLEAYFNSTRNKKYVYGVHYKHLSSAYGAVQGRFSSTGENDIDVYGRYFQGQNTWTAELNYHRFKYHFYGFPSDTLLPEDRDDIKQLFHIYNAKIGLKHLNPKSNFTYKAKLHFNYISDNYEASESTLYTGGHMAYRIDDLSKIKMKINTYIGQRSDSVSLFRQYYQVIPTYERKHEIYLIKGGLNVVYDNDTLLGGSGFHFYPVLHVDVRLEELHEIHAYGGVSGDLERIGLRDIALESPYITDNIIVNNQNNNLSLYVGARATLKEYITLHAKVNYSTYKNFYHYVRDTLSGNKIQVLYDTANTNVFNVDFEAMYRKNEVFGTGLKLDADFYSLSSFDKAYHRPNFQVHYLADYKFKNKLKINADIYYISGIFAYDFDEQMSVRLDDIIDVNLKGTYYFNQKFSAFVELNNLVSQSYSYYQYYQSKRINFLVGAGYIF